MVQPDKSKGEYGNCEGGRILRLEAGSFWSVKRNSVYFFRYKQEEA